MADRETDRARRAADAYLYIVEYLLLNGYAAEIDDVAAKTIDAISESSFLAEAAWVVISAGFQEAVVRRIFPGVSVAFMKWRSADAILVNHQRCVEAALRVFRNRSKIEAIVQICSMVSNAGFERVRRALLSDPLPWLATLPRFGHASVKHLAKNLGLDVVKPDRHLLRVTQLLGFQTPDELANAISAVTGDRLRTIDTVFWRYGTVDPGYAQLRRHACG